jgi:hypothetical protein
MKTVTSTLLAFGAGVAILAAAQAQAQSFVALSDNNTLTMVDLATGRAGASVTVRGGPGRLLGIDQRPANKMLYGLYADGTLATINPATGVATVLRKLQRTLPSGVQATVDFNPMADRLRIIGSDGTSLRANVDTGEVAVDGSLKYADADTQKGAKPMVTAGAYSNSFAGTTATVLYDIDSSVMALLRQVPPNDGVLNTIGFMNAPSGPVAFDILSTAAGANTAVVVTSGTIFRVDLANGQMTRGPVVTGVRGVIRDIAVMTP